MNCKTIEWDHWEHCFVRVGVFLEVTRRAVSVKGSFLFWTAEVVYRRKAYR